MRNIHPLFKPALVPFAPPAPAMRPFAVRINVAGHPEELNVLAESSCDAIVRALDIFFEADGVMPPEGLSISAHPIAILTRAA
jgi:hypothetical protein